MKKKKSEKKKSDQKTVPKLSPFKIFSRENSPIILQLTIDNINSLNISPNCFKKRTNNSSLGQSFGSSLPSFDSLNSSESDNINDNKSPNNKKDE